MTAHRIAATLARCAVMAFLLGTLMPAGHLQAQAGGGAIGASTEILPVPLTGTGVQPLQFGHVTLGQVVDVPPGPAGTGATTSSAGWTFGKARKGDWVSLTLLLPPVLTRGAASLPVDWDNADYAQLCLTKNGGACVWTDAYNPGAEPGRAFQIPNTLPGNNFDLDLYIGARIVVPTDLPPGLYTGVVTVVFAVVG